VATKILLAKMIVSLTVNGLNETKTAISRRTSLFQSAMLSFGGYNEKA